MHITDKVAVVSGGASGLGAATARRLASEGARVGILDFDAERGAAVAAEIMPGRPPVKAMTIAIATEA